MPSPAIREPAVTVRAFARRFSPAPRGARLARRLALHQLGRWHLPYGSETSDAVGLLVAEPAADAVTHGRVPGRDFEPTLAYAPGPRLRIDASDARGERRPAPVAAGALDEGGRGLLLVEALASRWAVPDRVPVGKTVRAELGLSPGAPRTRPDGW
ncbi:ATP-binding protein [Streptomyces litmocidini]|uniref:ATP-binding protein n=1 Tax=Streptomyces litmocidini TaxID=67318 RepID=UPI00167E4EC7|nr:ATP-binding protein [Streptomyces litmocidini]GGV07518.1 ATP-binding protein [Streptomyces litmocidini]